MKDIETLAEIKDLDQEYSYKWIKDLNLNTFSLL